MPMCSLILIRVGRGYREVTTAEVAGTRYRTGRCIICQEPVVALLGGKDGRASYAKHLHENAACPLSRAWHRTGGVRG